MDKRTARTLLRAFEWVTTEAAEALENIVPDKAVELAVDPDVLSSL